MAFKKIILQKLAYNMENIFRNYNTSRALWVMLKVFKLVLTLSSPTVL